WEPVDSPVDVVILEGWCIGTEAQADSELRSPINDLERIEDPDASWRSYSNQKLKKDYAKLFGMLDKLIVLKAPSFESVYDWRWLQEQKLIEQWERENSDVNTQLLDENGVRRFISHYERLTRHSLANISGKADWLLTLNDQHLITNLVERK
ncbi:MAG: D-glycerate 3-kinase, partial [Oceanicoccus sp.]